MQQMQSDDASDELIVTKMGSAVRAAMAAKEDLQNSIAEAIDASTTFGYELGAEDMKVKIIQALEADDSVCSNYALVVIDSIFKAPDEL